MVGFSRNYKTFQEVLSLTKESVFGDLIVQIISIGAISIILSLLVLFVFPFMLFVSLQLKTAREKVQKKRVLTQILLQKELENEVEQEIKAQETS